MLAQCDKRGRIYLREEVRERYGDTFRIVEAPDEIILIPVSDDPLKELKEIGKQLKDYTLEELKEGIQKQAEEEIMP